MTTGLEHIGMTVPDQEAAAKFYGLIFDPQLFQERDPPPRFYTRIGISDATCTNAPHTPMSNLLLSVMDKLGVHQDRHGDSTGKLEI